MCCGIEQQKGAFWICLRCTSKYLGTFFMPLGVSQAGTCTYAGKVIRMSAHARHTTIAMLNAQSCAAMLISSLRSHLQPQKYGRDVEYSIQAALSTQAFDATCVRHRRPARLQASYKMTHLRGIPQSSAIHQEWFRRKQDIYSSQKCAKILCRHTAGNKTRGILCQK